MIDGWFVVRSFLTENPKFSAHIFALPLDVNVPHSVEQKARLSREQKKSYTRGTAFTARKTLTSFQRGFHCREAVFQLQTSFRWTSGSRLHRSRTSERYVS